MNDPTAASYEAAAGERGQRQCIAPRPVLQVHVARQRRALGPCPVRPRPDSCRAQPIDIADRESGPPPGARGTTRTLRGVMSDSERTGKSLYSADAKRAHDTRQDFFRFHEVLIATVFCDFSARGAPVPKDQELTARSRVRLDTCRCQVVCILYSRLQSHHASAQTRIEPVLTSSPRLTRQLAQCPGTPRRP
jgi:hypothetical protein